MHDLLIKYVFGETTPSESAEVRRWLQSDPANRKLYEQYKTIWEMGRKTANREADVAGPAETREAWRMMSARLGKGDTAKVEERGIKDSPRSWLRMAAVMVGLLLLGAGGYKLLLNRQPTLPKVVAAGRTVQHPAPATEVPRMMKSAGLRPRVDTLPDGTVVTLNRGASMQVAGGTTEKGLQVRLHGEGFFQVPHHPTRPFVVEAGGTTITVLGTSFELNEKADSTELVVENGAVMVARNVPDRDSMILHAGEQLTVRAGGKWKKTKPGDYLYWYYLGRPLICDNTPLRRLVETMNRTDGTPVVLGRPELGGLPLTTVFRGQSPDQIIKIVAMTFHLSIVRQGSAIVLQ